MFCKNETKTMSSHINCLATGQSHSSHRILDCQAVYQHAPGHSKSRVSIYLKTLCNWQGHTCDRYLFQYAINLLYKINAVCFWVFENKQHLNKKIICHDAPAALHLIIENKF